MTMPTLTEFLLARIAEDEAVAMSVANLSNGGTWWVDGPAERSHKHWIYDVGEKFTDRPVADHIARHDPARVLAECEAKRRIVGYRGPIGIPEDGSVRPGEGMSYLDGGHAAVAAERDRILRLLALPYSDHPDYDEAWRA